MHAIVEVGRAIDSVLNAAEELRTFAGREIPMGLTPASTDREIIDRSYSYALVVSFADEAAHDAYQVHPVHDRFREQCGGSWKKIVIYDAVSA